MFSVVCVCEAQISTGSDANGNYFACTDLKINYFLLSRKIKVYVSVHIFVFSTAV